MKFPGIILAAGQSTRMGQPKALVPLRDRTFLEHVAATFMASGVVDSIIVVTGAYSELVTPHAAARGFPTVYNPNYKTGMMTSLQKGIEALPQHCSAAFIGLVDMPMIHPSTLTKLVATCMGQVENSRSVLARPFYQGTPGHPCLIGRNFFDLILAQEPRDQGAAFLFKSMTEGTHCCEVDDRGVILDIDHMQDLENVGEHAAGVY